MNGTIFQVQGHKAFTGAFIIHNQVQSEILNVELC